MDDIELMPCPFCGGNDLRVASPSEAWVTCEECDAEGPTAWATEEAVRKWNAAATLRSRCAALEKALEPFANSDMRFAYETGHVESLDSCVAGVCDFTIGDLLDARAALDQDKGGGNE